jgi:hypothetical protein
LHGQHQESVKTLPMDTDLSNMRFHPLEKLALILQAVVQAQCGIPRNLFAGEETIRSNPVIEVDHNHVSFGRTNEVFAVQVCIAIDDEASSLNENEDRQIAVSRGVGRRKHISKETIL